MFSGILEALDSEYSWGYKEVLVVHMLAHALKVASVDFHVWYLQK